MIIDAHAHIVSSKHFDRLIDKGGEWTKQRAERFAETARKKPYYDNIALRLEHMDRNNIDFQVVTPEQRWGCNIVPGGLVTQLAYAKVLNEAMASIMEESKGRLIAAGTIPIAGMDQGGRQEMERAINTLGLKAINTLSNIAGNPLDSPEFEPFLAQAAEMDVAVYIHPRNPASSTGRSYEADYDLVHNLGWTYETALILSRLVFSGIMERYPTLKIVCHHLGGMIPFFMGRTEETYGSENPDNIGGKRGPAFSDGGGAVPGRLFDYFSRFNYDTAVGGSVPATRCAYEVFGADPIVFGTDYPAGPGGKAGDYRLTTYPKVIEALGLPEEDKEKIFSGNIRKILKLD